MAGLLPWLETAKYTSSVFSSVYGIPMMEKPLQRLIEFFAKKSSELDNHKR